MSQCSGTAGAVSARGAGCLGFKAYDKRFYALIDTNQEPLLLYEGGTWLEGPQMLPDGSLAFSDVKQNKLLRLRPPVSYGQGELSVWLFPSHFQNGHALDTDGRLIAASHGRRGIERLNNHQEWKLLTDRYAGGLLNSPNDLIVDSGGLVWFTDPRFGLQNPLEGYGGSGMQGGDYVYRFNPESGEIVRLEAAGLGAPNGLALSPDEALLYVADSERAYDFNNKDLHSQILVYEVCADKSLGRGRVFAQIEKGIPDGIKIDTKGNVWSSSGGGIIVFSPEGDTLGEIIFPEPVSNLTFSLSLMQKKSLQKGGVHVAEAERPGTTMFVTSGSKLYMFETRIESGIKRSQA